MDKYDLLYQKYTAQMSTVTPNDFLSRTEFEARFASKLVEMHLIELDASCFFCFMNYGRLKSLTAIYLHTGTMLIAKKP